MINTELLDLIRSIRAISLNNKLSDEATFALTNIHLSLMNMIVVNMLEDEYGNPMFHREAIEKLFSICCQRSASHQSLSRRCRMTPILYSIFYMPDTIYDDHKFNIFYKRAVRIFNDWRGKFGNCASLNAKARTLEYDILRSHMDSFAYVIDEDKVDNAEFLYIKHRISDWALELNNEGRWATISDYEAMRRIDIMTGNSNTHGDNHYDAQIEKAQCFYFNKLTNDDHIDCRAMYYLYRTMLWGICTPDYEKIDIIAKRACCQIDSHAIGSDEWLWLASIVIDSECVKIYRNVQLQLIAYSA